MLRQIQIRSTFASKVLALLVIAGSMAIFAVAQDQNSPPPPPADQNAPHGDYNPPPPPPPANNENQPYNEAPPQNAMVPPQQLDGLVSRIALYPDPLLAQVLTAATYSDQIPEAAQWANEHASLHGDALADAIREDNLQFDPSVMALLPFPSVLNMMAQDPQWTQQLGNAVLAERPAVMDAVQHQRHEAYQYGYLRSNPYDRVVDSENDIQILPVNPGYIYVPTYDPYLVYGPPRPGFYIGGAIRFGPAIVLGGAFAPWGWSHPYFDWRGHGIFFDATPWSRGWVNRGYYAHPYAHPYVRRPGPRVEHHEVHREGRRR
ncbi:MAG TPA: DUF3300 domain-containing protein [Candidatus Sulfotelmatobacter sp.]|nr:DUF3300 domain-containing protein [Candidatus Sulfotelmatobacter sp.]